MSDLLFPFLFFLTPITILFWRFIVYRNKALKIRSYYANDLSVVYVNDLNATIIGKSRVSYRVLWLQADLIISKEMIIAIHYHHFLGFRLYQPTYLFCFRDALPLNDLGKIKMTIKNTIASIKSYKLVLKGTYTSRIFDFKMECNYNWGRKEIGMDEILKQQRII